MRALRQRSGLTQAALASRLEISASYLNLIEHDRRPLTAELLIRLARELDVALDDLEVGEDAQLTSDLAEVFGDPLLEGMQPSDSEQLDLVAAHPDIARAMVRLHHAYSTAQASAQALAADVLDRQDVQAVDTAGLAQEQVTEFLQRHRNHFPTLEDHAERVWRDGALDIPNLFGSLSAYLRDRHGVRVHVLEVAKTQGAVRRYEPESRTLLLSEVLRRGSRHFQLAYQIGLLECSEDFDRLLGDGTLTSEDARALGRVTLANYFASTIIMPYARFREAAHALRHDLDLLQHRFRVNFEQVCHRLSTLQRKGAEGVPFYMVRIDLAGNISKKFGAGGMRFPRFGGLCPLRNVHRAFLQPNVLRVQLSRTPEGSHFVSVARTIRKHRGGYQEPEILYAIELGCETRWADRIVYADGIDLANPPGVVQVGVTCRLCERLDCRARAFPSIQRPLEIDENVRGVSFFAPVRGENG